jgi:hypothetical protein
VGAPIRVPLLQSGMTRVLSPYCDLRKHLEYC